MASFDSGILFNMLVATALSGSITLISKHINELIDFLIRTMKEIIGKKPNVKTSKINIRSTIVSSNDTISTNFQEEYCAIVSMIIKKKKDMNEITHLKEYTNSYWCSRLNEKDCFETYRFQVNTTKKIMLEDNIYIRFYEKQETTNNEKNVCIRYLTLEVFSDVYTVYTLHNKIVEWTKEYNSEKNKYKTDGKLYYYSMEREKTKKTPTTEKTESEDISKLFWKSNILTTFKNFDNIFFTDKEILRKKLNYFINNKDAYKKKGIPYNLGLLFYGAPGCGKTSCIKAISNYTNRHVVEINLSKIKTCSEFTKIFHDDNMDSVYVPHENKIIVLEDIDCMIDIIKSREKKEAEPEKQNDTGNLTGDNILKMLLGCDGSPLNNNNEDKLTLSCILNTIDGVLENYGRILIMSTNYHTLLDKALIRPGRIDAKINFTPCTVQMYFDIIENFYNTKISESIQFTQHKHTPAEVLEMCSLYNDDITKSIELLTKT